MKNIAFLGIFLVFSASAASYAVDNNYLISSDGSVQSAPSSARPASPEENRAINEAMANPGMEVPFGLQQEKIKRVDFFHGVTVSDCSKVVAYNNGKIEIIDKANEESQPFILPHVTLMLVSMGLMAIALVLLLLVHSKCDNTAFAAAAFAVVASAAAASAAAAFAIAASAFAASAFAIAAENSNNKLPMVTVAVVYYLFAILTLLA